MNSPDDFQLDDTDFRILSALQNDCRKSITNIADEIGSSLSTVSTRLKKMVHHDIVRHQMRIFSEGGYHFSSTNLKLRVKPRNKLDEVIQTLRDIPEVVFLLMISGSFQLEARMICRDQTTLHRVIKNKINSIDGIIDYTDHTYLAVYKWKQPDPLHLAEKQGIIKDE